MPTLAVKPAEPRTCGRAEGCCVRGEDVQPPQGPDLQARSRFAETPLETVSRGQTRDLSCLCKLGRGVGPCATAQKKHQLSACSWKESPRGRDPDSLQARPGWCVEAGCLCLQTARGRSQGCLWDGSSMPQCHRHSAKRHALALRPSASSEHLEAEPEELEQAEADAAGGYRRA